MCYHLSIMIEVKVVVNHGIKLRVAGEGECVVAGGETGEHLIFVANITHFCVEKN